MKTNQYIQRIAVLAPNEKKRELIEWSYSNREVLRHHELMATAPIAYLLEGTVEKEVERLDSDYEDGATSLIKRIRDQKVDVLVYFENPAVFQSPTGTMQRLIDTALEKDVVLASYKSNIQYINQPA